MSTNQTGYAQSQGVKLLSAAVQEFGPIFTLDQIRPVAKAQQLSDTHLRFLISSLAGAGWIEIIKRGTYVVKSPLYSGDIHPFAIATALVDQAAISHWSACAHHGFTTQFPTMVQATTSKKVITPEMRTGQAHSPRGRAVWEAYGLEFEFIHTKQEKFWGFADIWVDTWHRVNITDPERTCLDLFARPDVFGGVAAVQEILQTALPHIQMNRFIDYALRYNTGSVIKRIGWSLEQLAIPSSEISRLQSHSVRGYYPLDPTREAGGQKNVRWNIIENLGRE